MIPPFQPTPKNLETAELLLVNPDFSKNELGVASLPENPLGLTRIAGYLAGHGHSCHVLDTTGRGASKTGPEELGDWLNENANRYRVIGFHANSWNINPILRILNRARGVLRKKKLLFGGPLPNSEPERMTRLLADQRIGDIGVVQGLGEKITEEILSRDQLIGIDGLWAVENGKWQKGHKVTLTRGEYERTPFLSLAHNPFYQQYFKPALERGSLDDSEINVIFSSQGLDVNRGCPFACTYCSVPQYEEKMIERSPKRVADELEYLAREAGFFMFTFTNSNILFLKPDWVREFCHELIGRGMNHYLNWTAYHHPSILSRLEISDYHLMKKAGMDTVVFGVQSFEDRILKLFLRPPDTPELTRMINEKARKAKQEVTVDYITGVPGEDLDVIEQAFRFFAENDIECRNYQLKLYPNTRLQTMKMDLSHHELVPITGDLAPELEAYAVVSKDPNPRSAGLDAFIRESNTRILKKRPVRLGEFILRTPEQARALVEETIPNHPDIPDRVKSAMSIAIRAMLKPKKRQARLDGLSPAEMMKTVVLAGPDSPPMVLAMQAKLRREMGEEKFARLKAQFKKSDF